MARRERKVVVIGAGAVGATYIYALLQTGMPEEIALIDVDRDRVEGEIMDLSHGLQFIPPVSIKAGEYEDCADASMIVITAGGKQSPGQSRADLIRKNAGIVRSICTQIAEQSSEAVVVMVTNPVDSLTHVALDCLGWPRQRVIGSGTVLDSARFKFMLSRHCGIDARNVHAYIIGEHGDSEVAAWSLSHIAGVSIEDYCRICQICDYKQHHKQIAEQVRDSAYHIIDYKGSTYYGIGLSLVRISGAILRNENSVLTVSTLLQGEYGIHDICLSVPCIVGESGVIRIIDAQLAPEEQEALNRSAQAIARTLATARQEQLSSV
jgi:L-lactate dehydrogenase